MAGFSIGVHPAARADVTAAYDWYFERNPQAAATFIREIEAALAAISDNPLTWPSYIEGTRRYVLRRFPFSVVYRIQGSEILVCGLRARAETSRLLAQPLKSSAPPMRDPSRGLV